MPEPHRRTAYCLFFIHLGSRKVLLCPATYHPDEAWVKQQARNVSMWLEDNNIEANHLINDRDTKFSVGFNRLFSAKAPTSSRRPCGHRTRTRSLNRWWGRSNESAWTSSSASVVNTSIS